jgi:hypothetical protein
MFYDDFQRENTTIGLGTSSSGHLWTIDSGARIQNGKYVPSFNTIAAAYPRVDAIERVRRQEANIYFNGSASQKAIALICAKGGQTAELSYGGAYYDMIHFAIWPLGIQLNFYTNGVAGDLYLNEVLALPTDGTSLHFAIDFDYRENTATITMHDGSTRGPFYDPLVSAYGGNQLIYEVASFATDGTFDFGFNDVSAFTETDPTSFATNHEAQIKERNKFVDKAVRRRYHNVASIRTYHEDTDSVIPFRREEWRYPLTSMTVNNVTEKLFYSKRFNHQFISDVLITLEDGATKYAKVRHDYATDELTIEFKDDSIGEWSIFSAVEDDTIG